MLIKDILITGVSYFKRPEKRPLIKWSYFFRSKKGLEIGGPSAFFSLKGYFPVYLFAKQIDGVNYSSETVWEGKIKEGNNYKYHNRTGYQYIKEATELDNINGGEFDFILSCHSLEHVANPLKALKEWAVLLKKNGYIILVLPHKDFSFDTGRDYTSIEHLITDFKNGMTEKDDTHFKEVIDNLRDNDLPMGLSKDEIIRMIENNYENRCVHHHVFNFELITAMFNWAGFEIRYQSQPGKVNLFTIAQKK